MNGIQQLLRHDRWIVLAGLAGITALSWSYLWDGAGMGMSALDMTVASLFPHLQPHVPGRMEASWTAVVLMWWVMMIAMMTPSAAPLVLLHGLVLRRHGKPSMTAGLLLAGYLSVWLLFSLAAAAMQKALEGWRLISEMMLWSRSSVLSATVLAAAGIYQLSPWKHACLSQCRAPARFLTEHWRPGAAGPLLLGMRHGVYCVGCCWLLMALLFVGGIMNLLWIAVLTAMVLAERLLPQGNLLARASGCLLLAWAAATVVA